MACKSASTQINYDFPSGKYKIMSLNAENYKAKKDYFVNINTEENQLGGKFDCNNFNVDYQKAEDSISFGYAVATKMYCEGQMHNENAFLSKLKAMKTLSYQNETLKFFDEKNNLIVELKYVKDE